MATTDKLSNKCIKQSISVSGVWNGLDGGLRVQSHSLTCEVHEKKGLGHKSVASLGSISSSVTRQ